MKRRNAETGKMRRLPIKRTKIAEGMCDNMMYLRFVMLWTLVVLCDHWLEFRFEFLWPFWMMFRSVYDSFKYQGLAFSVFFICITLTSDLICFFFIPVYWIFFAASTYVWVQYIWYTVMDKGVCVPTVVLCCALVYVEGAVRGGDRGGGLEGPTMELCRPFAAHCVGFPVVTFGFCFKSFVDLRLRMWKQQQVEQENEFYFRIMREALPESELEQNQTASKESEKCPPSSMGNGSVDSEHRHMNGGSGAGAGAAAGAGSGARARRSKHDLNGSCHHEHSAIQINNKVEKQLSNSSVSKDKDGKVSHSLSNGTAAGAEQEDDRRDNSRGSSKSSKCEKKEKEKESSTLKEERRKNRSKDKDKDKDNCDSLKSTEQSKDNTLREKDVESTRENVKNKESNSNKDKEKERERERELREAREAREARVECLEELAKARAETATARAAEEEARRALAVTAASERQRRADYHQLRQQHTALQHKVQSWRTLERRLSEERRARATAEQQLQRAQQQANQRKSGECESESCRVRRNTSEAESTALRRELQRVREANAQLQRDLNVATEQTRTLEAERREGTCPRLAGAWGSLQERATHLERSLSAETRVKLDLLSALGEAKRQLNIKEGTINEQDKEIAELKSQLSAVTPPPDSMSMMAATNNITKIRLSDGSPLDPNASVYTPKQLCSDA